jgi:hypothetical protein
MTIEFHTWTTPNGRKVGVLLEELGLDYSVHTVNIGKDEQFEPSFLKISPNNRIPAIIDSDGPGGKPISVFETGAIMVYLAEKHGKFLPESGAERYAVMEWLMWQMGGVGPMLGQTHHFRRAAKVEVPYGIERIVCMASPTGDWPITPICLAIITASPIWRPSRGSRAMSGMQRISTIFRTSNGGMGKSRNVRRFKKAWPCRPSITIRSRDWTKTTGLTKYQRWDQWTLTVPGPTVRKGARQ